MDEPLRIVAIGGGTGLSTLLRGLKRYAPPRGDLKPAVEISAVVTVADDGGSSGRLRREFDMLPPGDIRNCMVALSEDEAMLSRLFDHRFASGRGLKGHSFGNLFLTAMTALTGNFAESVKMSSEILAIAGNIYPATEANVSLEAKLENGMLVRGETRISRSRSRIRSVRLCPANCQPVEETLRAIAEADLITIGPGSLYTSVVPNLLVEGIPEAICSSGALRAYFCNLMWQPGETTGMSASEHVQVIHEHARKPVIERIVVNNEQILEPALKKYEAGRQRPVATDREQLDAMGLTVVEAHLASSAALVRHDPDRTAAVAMCLAAEGRRAKRAGQLAAERSALLTL